MTAPVRIDAEAWSDLRFATLARILKLADRDHALIKVARIWSWQAENYTPEKPTYVVDQDTIDSALGDGGSAAMVRARLAEEVPDGFRIKGAKGKIEWLWKLRQSASKGGEATQAKRRSSHEAGHVASERESADQTPPPASGKPHGEATASHVAPQREPDNIREPHGSPSGTPDGLPGPSPLTLTLPDQRSDLSFRGAEEEGPRPQPPGDRDREAQRHGPLAAPSTLEEWRARRDAEDAERLRQTYGRPTGVR